MSCAQTRKLKAFGDSSGLFCSVRIACCSERSWGVGWTLTHQSHENLHISFYIFWMSLVFQRRARHTLLFLRRRSCIIIGELLRSCIFLLPWGPREAGYLCHKKMPSVLYHAVYHHTSCNMQGRLEQHCGEAKEVVFLSYPQERR